MTAAAEPTITTRRRTVHRAASFLFHLRFGYYDDKDLQRLKEDAMEHYGRLREALDAEPATIPDAPRRARMTTQRRVRMRP